MFAVSIYQKTTDTRNVWSPMTAGMYPLTCSTNSDSHSLLLSYYQSTW